MPAGTPQAIIDLINRETAVVQSDRDIAKRLTDLAIAPIIESPAALATRIAQEQQKWKRVIEGMGK